MKTVLITGGSGFLGRSLIEKAVATGYKVFAPPSKVFDLLDFNKASSHLQCMEEAGNKPEVIIHSAAYYGGIGINQSEPANIFFRNSQMAVNIFELAAKHNIKKVIPIGSACSYPGHITGDLEEKDFWDGALHHTVEAYGFSKKLQQVAQRAYFKQYGIESNHLILTNLYGERDVFTEYRSHVVSALIKKFADAQINNSPEVTLWGDGSPIREFLYAGDAAEAIIKSIEMPHDTEPINIGTGIGTSIKELAEVVMEFTEFSGSLVWDTSKPNGTLRKVLNVNKMKEKLDFYPKYNLRNGLKLTIDWYLKNKEEADARE